jgi:hypothetical protein
MRMGAMNDEQENRSDLPVVKVRRRFLVLLLLPLVMVGVMGWAAWPRHDPRLFGDWYTDIGLTWRFHPNGQLDLLPTDPASGVKPREWQRWHTEQNGLFVGPRTDVLKQLDLWLRGIVGRLTFAGASQMGGPQFVIVEVTDSTLRLQPVGPLVRRPLPSRVADVVLSRTPVKKD